MTPVVVYGAGGHGKVVADAALAAGYDVVGFVDDWHSPGKPLLSGAARTLRVVGTSLWLSQQAPLAVVLGQGEPAARRRAANECRRWGHHLVTLVHPSAVVSRFAVVGEGTVVLATAVINPAASVGGLCIVNTGAIVEHDVVVGELAQVSPNATLAGAARLGAESQLGSAATVLPQVSVGCRTIVGAGAVVHRDAGDDLVLAGVPARVLRTRALGDSA